MNLPGASELATIVGVPRLQRDGTPYLSRFTLWARLVGVTARYDATDPGPDAEAGNDMEAGIGLRWSGLHGHPVMVPGPHIPTPGYGHADLPWTARPDFLVPEFRCVVEAKAPREFTEEWGPDFGRVMPAYYGVQLLGQVGVAALCWSFDRGYLFARARAARWHDRRQAEYLVEHDEQRIGAMVSKVRQFLEQHVATRRAPMVDGSRSTTETLAEMFRPAEATVPATAEDVAHWTELVQVRSAIDDLEARRRELEASLKARMGTATVLEHGADRLATWRERSGSTRIDLDRLRRERPDIARQYAETGSAGRSFNLKR